MWAHPGGAVQLANRLGGGAAAAEVVDILIVLQLNPCVQLETGQGWQQGGIDGDAWSAINGG